MRIPKTIVIIIFYIMITMSALSAENDNDSTFLWGLGALPVVANHYRGSDQFTYYIIPAPYIYYRSEKLEADSSVVRGVLYRNDFLVVKVSMAAGLAAESKDNRARKGMPNLGYTVEAGPMVVFNLWESSGKVHKLTFETAVRQGIASDFTFIKPVGIFNVSYFNLESRPTPLTFNWGTGLSAALMFADHNYHSYFYSVKRKYVTDSRPYYNAPGGYSGVHFMLVASRRIGDIMLIPLLRYDYLRGVAFRDSPLSKSRHFFFVGMGTFYLFD